MILYHLTISLIHFNAAIAGRSTSPYSNSRTWLETVDETHANGLVVRRNGDVAQHVQPNAIKLPFVDGLCHEGWFMMGKNRIRRMGNSFWMVGRWSLVLTTRKKPLWTTAFIAAKSEIGNQRKSSKII